MRSRTAASRCGEFFPAEGNRSLEEVRDIQVVVFLEDDGTARGWRRRQRSWRAPRPVRAAGPPSTGKTRRCPSRQVTRGMLGRFRTRPRRAARSRPAWSRPARSRRAAGFRLGRTRRTALRGGLCGARRCRARRRPARAPRQGGPMASATGAPRKLPWPARAGAGAGTLMAGMPWPAAEVSLPGLAAPYEAPFDPLPPNDALLYEVLPRSRWPPRRTARSGSRRGRPR